ncbi:MAG: FliA/WhiG family RNA polymerase sigma factor [Armatimonadota bacterium]|nr:FliA/WhiG family RNA polymerase sigma factor [Armatimonadota bacterium]MDR7466433.1 FliA/WhiG family RNA polymerase sigma factor [Armatimonadota bacterium]MDR7503554.1 FliA/WhiG family RNA polymerase sigma factor [Armatimonadota bacterium]MDR7545805.1 FliA/WhiG family RNA polymerase sigma factor [Armatimonadota bacterium]MDR7551484.1 FliA/WhiG family RNA polymerase sigma factor [Armatimonadota bacterium]
MADHREDAGELWARLKTRRDGEARERLALLYLPLVRAQAGQMAGRLPPSVRAEDLEGYGIVGLLEAIDRYDPDRGIPFEAFARLRIRGAMYDYLRTLDLLPRVARRTVHRVQAEAQRMMRRLGRPPTDGELARATGFTPRRLGRVLQDARGASLLSLEGEFAETDRLSAQLARDAGDDVLLDVERDALDAELWRAIAALPVRHKVVVGLYYCEGLTLAEIGRILGVTESRVGQLRREALHTLRTHLALAHWLEETEEPGPRTGPGQITV